MITMDPSEVPAAYDWNDDKQSYIQRVYATNYRIENSDGEPCDLSQLGVDSAYTLVCELEPKNSGAPKLSWKASVTNWFFDMGDTSGSFEKRVCGIWLESEGQDVWYKISSEPYYSYEDIMIDSELLEWANPRSYEELNELMQPYLYPTEESKKAERDSLSEVSSASCYHIRDYALTHLGLSQSLIPSCGAKPTVNTLTGRLVPSPDHSVYPESTHPDQRE